MQENSNKPVMEVGSEYAVILVFLFMLMMPGLRITAGTTVADCVNDPNQQMDDAMIRLLTNKLKLLHRLVHDSSAAGRIEQSDNEQAKTLLNRAQESYSSSESLLEQGCAVAAEEKFNHGLQYIQSASSGVEDDQRTDDIARHSYEQLTERLKTFRKSYDSIVQEKGDRAINTVDEKSFEELVSQAKAHAEKNDYRQAAGYLEKAVGILESGLSIALDKETIVHEFKFDSIEDEYAYLHETNESYVRLLNLVLGKLDKNSGKHELLDNLVKHNKQLLDEADAIESSGNIESALKILEQGNIELIRAMSITGIGQ